jgi:hypothetical protein
MAPPVMRTLVGWAVWIMLVYGLVEVLVSAGLQLHAARRGMPPGSCPADGEVRRSILGIEPCDMLH